MLMRELMKYIGMIVVILGTIYLMIVVLLNLDNNHHLLISGIIVFIGLAIHLVLNKELE
jgi:hypothetical protein